MLKVISNIFQQYTIRTSYIWLWVVYVLPLSKAINVVIVVPVGVIRLVRSHMFLTDRLYGVSHIPRQYFSGMAKSLSRRIVYLIHSTFTHDTPIGVYSYMDILRISDYNSGIEVTESFKYPLDIISEKRKNND